MSNVTLLFLVVLVAVVVMALGAGVFYTRRERRSQRLHDPIVERDESELRNRGNEAP